MQSSRTPLNKIHDIGVTIYPDKSQDAQNADQGEDFYSSDMDDSDDKYVNDNFRQGDKSTDAVLCCAGCFTPVCYQCKTLGNSFSSKSAVNVYVDDTSGDSLPEDGGSALDPGPETNKRKFQKNEAEPGKIAKCIECNNAVAVLDDANNYVFTQVIASQP